MQAEPLKELVIEALEDMKGRDITSLEVSDMTTITDYMIVVTGTSSRHTKSIADEVLKRAKEFGINFFGIEGHNGAEWILLDLGDVVVHVMQEETRKFYDLESLWGITVAINE